MSEKIPKEDLLKFLAGQEGSLPKARREALEAELDRRVDEAVEAMPRAEVTPAFDRAVFAKIEAIDERARTPFLEHLLGPWRRSLSEARGAWMAAAAAVAVVVIALSWNAATTRPVPGVLSRTDTFELAENLDLYEDLDVIENLDVLQELDLIESLEAEEAG